MVSSQGFNNLNLLTDAAVPSGAAEASTSCTAVSRARALKPPGAGHRAVPAKSQGHGKLGVPEGQNRPLMSLQLFNL